MKSWHSKVIAGLCLLIVVSFFLPWVQVNFALKGTISALFGKKDSSMLRISGCGVPGLANRPDVRDMLKVGQIFNRDLQDTDKKSYAIWAVPTLAVLLMAGALFWGNRRWLSLLEGLLGLAIFAVGLYKMKTVDTGQSGMTVHYLHGLWFTLLGYLGVGLAGLAALWQSFRKSIEPEKCS